ncbi:hypothetical protein [Spiribacter onubensis]|uniref:Solute-binding protein family 3/N-terminal domain-containing protein n=1 Tax=Spiribacter onubensis TaxID=3122420 RepID=A0ABV3S7K8_9GAMM
MPSVAERLRAVVQRTGRSGVLIIAGIIMLLAVRELPPDSSLADVREAGTLIVCVPPSLPPLLIPQPGSDRYEGTEAALVRSITAGIGVSVQWNPQPGWGDTIDPSDWGLRPSACDLVVGGIVAAEETRSLLELVPYHTVRWAFAGDPGAGAVGLYVPFWGVDRGRAARWLRDEGYDLRFFFNADVAREALSNGEVRAVLSLEPVAEWIAAGQDIVTPTTGLPGETLAVATWKGRTTLNRAVQRAVPSP